jgi:ABC-type polysaccharide/polyol phosphate transport system ATPase subunit
MSSDRPTIEAHAVGKAYELGEIASLKLTAEAAKAKLLRRPREPNLIQALDGVSFSVNRGEAFAILGRNGSGKSTLVRLISGVTVPSAGSILVRGRVMPLLSIGAGFKLELTGRENVLMFGAVLGIEREEIDEALPRVAEFAEIQPAHMDTPFKRYSSGMRSRLSFATALGLPAEIYILDEVLAMADDEFKERAIEQMKELRDSGATVIFISHELPLLEHICDRGIWLDQGKVFRTGTISELAPAYREDLHAASIEKNQTHTGLRPPSRHRLRSAASASAATSE